MNPRTSRNGCRARRCRDFCHVCIFVWLLVIGLFTTLAHYTADAQVEQKTEPTARRLDLPASEQDSASQKEKAQLPKIDLPQYTITGRATMDAPSVEKQPPPDDSQSGALEMLLNAPLLRSRKTAETALGSKQELAVDNGGEFNGKAFASLGTFFTTHAGLWFGQNPASFDYSADATYYRTKGFAPYTDRSGGSIGGNAGTTLNSVNPWFDRARIRGELSYRSDTYNWYGSRLPILSRNRTDFDLNVGLSNWTGSLLPYEGDLGLESFQVTDSSRSVVETQVSLTGASQVSVSSVPVTVRLDGRFGSLANGFGSTAITWLDLQAGSQHYVWSSFGIRGSLHAYFGAGMDDQHMVRMYPHITVDYGIDTRNVLIASYEPAVKAASFSTQVFANRYLSGLSKLRHADDQQDATLALESIWSEATSTRLSVHVQSMLDYPLYADSLSQGVWQLAYGGRTTLASFSAEVFAKFASNDYFSGTFTANASNNSLISSTVPYLPTIEVGASYSRQFTTQWTGIARLTLIHQRNDNVVRISTVPSILLVGLRCEYRFYRQATAFLDIQNLLNEQYEYWKGYQENPFVLSAGIALRW